MLQTITHRQTDMGKNMVAALRLTMSHKKINPISTECSPCLGSLGRAQAYSKNRAGEHQVTVNKQAITNKGLFYTESHKP